MTYLLKEIWIYPIKSLGGIQLETCNTITEGLEHDRRWMLVDEQGIFMSQRTCPEMALFSCRLTDRELIINYKGDSVEIPLSEQSDKLTDVQVWESNFKAHEVSDSISQWFSDRLSQKVTLVRMTEDSNRTKALKEPPYETNLSMADGYPYLLLGTASMKQLNEKLTTKISANRFRANLIIETDVPHVEDTWKNVSIGNTSLQIIKPCARCQVITIDQETGKQGKEPTKTLASYRKESNKILFGVNAICTQEGRVAVGDEVNLINNIDS